ncbi:hypothetical protein F1654_00260 [Alkalicaulis satelles]|uniref:Anti-sigma factor n=1 Tax=Alkalicaulis satelles TaxID=2609175 RepID=A0A5M6ZI39_9PROT|nr:hypothetical protein [Alkalicaulis satelles]KAA5804483.1 hypothetical protein F1654_00260 [Alkalicaulis satelles]
MKHLPDTLQDTDAGPLDALARDWLDGALDPDSPEAALARQALESDSGLAARIESDRAAEQRLAAALDAYARPQESGRAPALIARAARRAEAADRWVRRTGAAAAAILVFAGGWMAGSLPASDPGQPPSELVMLGGQAADATAFQAGLANEPVMAPPELTGHGLQLTASITRAAPDGALNALEYAGPQGETVRILVRRTGPAPSETLHQASMDGDPLVWWREGDHVIGVTGPLRRDALTAIAEDVRLQARGAPVVADFSPAPELGVQVVSDPG